MVSAWLSTVGWLTVTDASHAMGIWLGGSYLRDESGEVGPERTNYSDSW